jgi:cation transport ATPase
VTRISWILCLLSGLSLGTATVLEALESDNFWVRLISHPEEHAHEPEPWIVALYAISILSAAWFIVPRAWRAIRHKHLEMNLLVLVAVGCAIALGELEEAASLMFLFSLASLIEGWSMRRARDLISAANGAAPAGSGIATAQPRFMDRFARWYMPIMLSAAVLTAIALPWAGKTRAEAFNLSLMVLLTACPCALVISTPITSASAMAAAARRGILFSGGAALEQASSSPDLSGLLQSGELVLKPGDAEQRELAHRHARHTVSTLTMNIAIAVGFKLLFLGFAYLDRASLWMAVAAHSGATLLVILNGLRMLSALPQPRGEAFRQVEQEP